MPLPINVSGADLGRENALLSGTGRRYYVPDFPGCLSIKSTVHGTARWQTDNRWFAVSEDTYLVVNDHQKYTITIDSPAPVTTFCLFFERGFVEESHRSMASTAEALIDEPFANGPTSLEFLNRLEPRGSQVSSLLRKFAARVSDNSISRSEWDELFLEIASALLLEQSQASAERTNIPAARRSTKDEIYRRLLRGRDYMISLIDQKIGLRDIAQAASLSPYHFHRAFKHTFRETPHEFLSGQRLKRAAHLLANSEMSITEICLECGFESLPSFSSLFRKSFSMNPSAFRRTHRAN